MGLKSTMTLSRSEVEARFVALYLERRKLADKARAKAGALTDRELEVVGKNRVMARFEHSINETGRMG